MCAQDLRKLSVIAGQQELLGLLLCHVGHVDWAAALLQPSSEDLPQVLHSLAAGIDQVRLAYAC